MAQDETYEHSDLVVAATLALKGIDADSINRRGRVVMWTYNRTSKLDDLLTEIRLGKCLVDPLTFARVLRSTRHEVYKLMEYDPPKVTDADEDDFVFVN